MFDAGRVYDLFGEILAALNYFSLALCLLLYIKVGFLQACHLPADTAHDPERCRATSPPAAATLAPLAA